MATIPYRPHIDGLRGVAVIAVVLYHAKLFFVTGGYVGVDVFFVISGFLITSIIVRDLETGTFSLSGFWERRIRRILPMLFVVIICTTVAGYFLILYPPDYQHFGTTVIAQSMFASNIVFMFADNYFEQSARFSPLLHTWSLSVEEQFYILFPLVVLFWVWLSGRHYASSKGHYRTMLLWSIGVLGIASFLANLRFVEVAHSSLFLGAPYATAGFYLLLTRAWELALGIVAALCAIKVRSLAIAETLSCAGILALTISLFGFNDGTAFPGVAALLPTLGAVAIIVANEHQTTKTRALLSTPVLVWFGLISYSLYLWHWPLFVFATLASTTPLSKVVLSGLIVVTVGLSWLSYTFIETPFRKKIIFPTRKDIFLGALSVVSLLVLLGLYIQYSASERQNRIPAAAAHILSAAAKNVPWGGVCFQLPGDEPKMCRIGDASPVAGQQFVVWGDSHAEAVVPLLNILGRAYGAQGAVFDGTFCIPVAGLQQTPPATGCDEKRAAALQYIADNNIKNIILIARWSYYVTGGQARKSAALISDSHTISKIPEQAQHVFATHLLSMVKEWSQEGRSVTIMEQVPEQPTFSIRDVFYTAAHTGQEMPVQGVSTAQNDTYQSSSNSVIEQLATLPGVHILNTASILCTKDGLCDLGIAGNLIYRDEDHISTAGAMSLEPLFTPIFASMASSKVH